jgi:hypothetical protein
MLYFEARPQWILLCGHGVVGRAIPGSWRKACFQTNLIYCFCVHEGELSLRGIFDRPTGFASMNGFGRARSELLMKRAASWE